MTKMRSFSLRQRVAILLRVRTASSLRLPTVALGATLAVSLGCGIPAASPDPAPRPMPTRFAPAGDKESLGDSASSASIPWREYFADSTLVSLIDSAVSNNAELLSTLAEVEVARQEIRGIEGRSLPHVGAGLSVGLEKTPRFTSQGAGDASTDITPGKRVPDVLPDLNVGFVASWEADVRGKIRSQKGAALARYLATVEGNRYVMTGLVAEVANTYYELIALDQKLSIIREAIALQERELAVVRSQKDAAVVTELAVKQFEALVLNARGMEYEVRQDIREAESRMNLLLGRYPQPVPRAPAVAGAAVSVPSRALAKGAPSMLLRNRPDIRGAELQLAASRLDVKAARAEFYPEVNLSGALGLRAFQPRYWFQTPESMAYSVASDILAPIFNRTTLKAEVAIANENQKKALYAYRQTVLQGFTEVSTLASSLENLDSVYALKARRVEALDQSTAIAGDLFNAARANYLEVLTAQRDAIDAKLELVETRLREEMAVTNLYRVLGGGWR